MDKKLLFATAGVALGSLLVQAGIAGDYNPCRIHDRGETGGAVIKKALQKRSQGLYGEGCNDVSKYGELEVLLSEDFSLMTTGSEAEPDYDTDLSIPTDDPLFQYPWNNMQPGHTQGDLRWGADGVYPAGGMICMGNGHGWEQAHIVTPLLDLSENDGSFVVEFRAKAINGETFPEVMIECSETRNWGPTWDNFDTPVTFRQLPAEWTTYRAVFRGGGPTSLINIVTTNIEGNGDNPFERPQPGEQELLIDDLKVYKLKPVLTAPKLLGDTNFSEKSFVLNWAPVDGAEKYLVTLMSGDLIYGANTVVFSDKETAETSMKIENTDPTLVYFYQVKAVKGNNQSLAELPMMVYGIGMPELDKAEPFGDSGIEFTGKVKPLGGAIGYNYMAMAKRTATEDGPFTVSSIDFNGWRNPALDDMDNVPALTLEDPWWQVSSIYYPLDLKQAGWTGYNMMTYKDFLCLDPYHFEMNHEKVAWQSPEFDLSKDGGKISIDLKLAAKPCPVEDEDGKTITYMAKCTVALFNWNEEKKNYEEVESVEFDGTKATWQDFHADLTKGSERSVIAFFASGSLDNLYLDDIVIKQNYKKGETFLDPFFFNPWVVSATQDNPTEVTFKVPDYASGMEVYNRASAVRAVAIQNGYSGVIESPLTPIELVGSTIEYSGVAMTPEQTEGTAVLNGDELTISNPEGAEVTVCGIDGRTVASHGTETDIRCKLTDAGVYIVRIGNKSIKVIR